MAGRGNTPPTEEHHPVSGKLRKPPPVTPKRFSKFFTPRSSANRVSKPTASRAGRQLRDITQSALNSRTGPYHQRNRSPKKTVAFQDLNALAKASHTPTSSARKRKSYVTPESSPPQSSPCKRVCLDDVIPSSPPAFLTDDLPVCVERSISPEPRLPPPRIRRAMDGNVNRRILQRTFGGGEAITRGRRRDTCIR
jgi:hypothetical protein